MPETVRHLLDDLDFVADAFQPAVWEGVLKWAKMPRRPRCRGADRPNWRSIRPSVHRGGTGLRG